MDQMKPSLPDVSFDADDSFEDNYDDAEVGTAIPIDGSSLNNDPVGNKQGELQASSQRSFWRCPLFVLIALLIVGLSIGISITTRRGNTSNLAIDAMDTSSPTLNPSSIPTITPLSTPSFYPSSVPSSAPSSVLSSAPSSAPSLSGHPSSEPSNLPSISSFPTTHPSSAPSLSASPSSQPSSSPTTELEGYVPNVSTLKNQIICGYQGWFAWPGDGAPINKWKHWFSSSTDPSPEHIEVDMYPYMDEYDEEDLMESNIEHRDGTKAKFFSSARPNVVKKHFEWMQDYGISGVFHMRFMQDIDKPRNYESQTKVLRNVKAAAESTGRVFAVSYNIAGNNLDDSVLDDLKRDWVDLVDNEQITSSGRYLHENGLPVLRIYGIGFKTVNVTNTDKMLELIEWFKSEADPKYRVFLIGGVPSGWRDLTTDSRADPVWRSVYESLDGIHPWHVGRWESISGFDSFYYKNVIVPDAALCAELGILYMPTMWPGFSWHNLNRKGRHQNTALRNIPLTPINAIPRLGGTFMWAQAYRFAENDNITSVWMAQFDEVDEGTAIFKVAKTEHELPAQGSWLTLDADGEEEIPRDWYLRLCGHAQRMMLKKADLTVTMPIKPSDYCFDCQGSNVADQ